MNDIVFKRKLCRFYLNINLLKNDFKMTSFILSKSHLFEKFKISFVSVSVLIFFISLSMLALRSSKFLGNGLYTLDL